MSKIDRLLKWLAILLGVAALAFFIYDFHFFQDLRPRMVAFKAVTDLDEQKIIWTGIGLLLYLGSCLITLLRTANYLRHAKKVYFISLILIAANLVALLFVFSDIALLSDIGKQHKYGFSQPEWSILYLVMTYQILVGIASVFTHIFGFKKENLLDKVTLDSNIYLIAQYVGLLCGLIGLVAAAFGYIYATAWKLTVHTTTSLILLLFPYGLVITYWLITKLCAKPQVFFDEKQQLDLGRSAFLTLLIDVVIMSLVFILNFNNLDGVTSINWLPIFLFSTLFWFSLGNLYFSQQNA